MTQNFPEFPPFPGLRTSDSTSELLDKAADAVSNAEIALANVSTHVLTAQQGGSVAPPGGEQLPLPADWADEPEPPVLRDVVPDRVGFGADGLVRISPPCLVVLYADGRVTVRTYVDASVMTRAHVQAVKPTGMLPAGTRVVAVYRDGSRVEKTKRAG